MKAKPQVKGSFEVLHLATNQRRNHESYFSDYREILS